MRIIFFSALLTAVGVAQSDVVSDTNLGSIGEYDYA